MLKISFEKIFNDFRISRIYPQKYDNNILVIIAMPKEINPVQQEALREMVRNQELPNYIQDVIKMEALGAA